jgi:hypothetical protein
MTHVIIVLSQVDLKHIKMKFILMEWSDQMQGGWYW